MPRGLDRSPSPPPEILEAVVAKILRRLDSAEPVPRNTVALGQLEGSLDQTEATVAAKDAGLKTRQHGQAITKKVLLRRLLEHEEGILPRACYEPSWKDKLKMHAYRLLEWIFVAIVALILLIAFYYVCEVMFASAQCYKPWNWQKMVCKYSSGGRGIALYVFSVWEYTFYTAVGAALTNFLLRWGRDFFSFNA